LPLSFFYVVWPGCRHCRIAADAALPAGRGRNSRAFCGLAESNDVIRLSLSIISDYLLCCLVLPHQMVLPLFQSVA
jgi:hypothetical protein